MRLAPFALESRPDGQASADSAAAAPSAAVSSVIARVDRRAAHIPVGVGRGQPGSRLVPAGVHREEQRADQLVGRGLARRLLLGLRREPAGLWPELAEDVLDPGEVRLRLDQLLLGAAAAALVAADAGDLLEQRPPFLGPQRERLIDHALADEQERVVGQVRRIEQVDEVAQPDPALVEQVVVLARAVEPPPELEDLEVDRQQAVGVVEDERDVGHPLRRALLRAGPDDVLRLA